MVVRLIPDPIKFLPNIKESDAKNKCIIVAWRQEVLFIDNIVFGKIPTEMITLRYILPKDASGIITGIRKSLLVALQSEYACFQSSIYVCEQTIEDLNTLSEILQTTHNVKITSDDIINAYHKYTTIAIKD